MAEYLLNLIEKYEGRVRVINDYLDENDQSLVTISMETRKGTYEEIISDLEFLLNNNQ